MIRPTVVRLGGALLSLAAATPAVAQSHGAHAERTARAAEPAPIVAGAARPAAWRNAPTLRATAAANVVNVVARDYAFDVATSIPAGPTTFRLTNMGTELHHVYLVKLEQGKTMRDFFDAMKAGPGPFPKWAIAVGGPNSPRPNGGQSNATLDLAPGTYAMFCVIPSPDGTPHVMKGMAKEITVTAPVARPAAARAALPTADVTMDLTSYAFSLDRPLRAGKQTLRVRNSGDQPHEVFIARLAPGKTVHDLLAWVEKPNGPPPGEPIGGTTDIPSGSSNWIDLDLAVGEYALICFSPDHKDGKPHFVHGMTRQFTVK